MLLATIGNLVVFVLLLLLLFSMQRRYVSFTKRVFAALGLGILYGLVAHLLYGEGAPVITDTLEYINIVGSGYVKLLQMIIIPLVMVSIISAILKLKDGGSVGRISAISIGVLVGTTMIAALVGIIVSNWFGLTAEGLTQGAAEVSRGESLTATLGSIKTMSFAQMILEFIPANPFLDMTGSRKTSTIAVVIFSVFIGLSATGIAKKKPEIFASFEHFMEVAHAIVMRMVTLVLRLTPYGVLALMAKVVCGSHYSEILNLIKFVAASYVALIAMFIIHLIIIAMTGVNPIRHVKKILPLLLFAFTSRTSAGSIPLNVRTQTQALGISESIANFSASFGATIGQNGCAGIYPAMLAVMIAPTIGIDPWSLSFIIPLIAIITVSSFGVAGVGGGATFAALIVLSSLDFPVALAGLLISIEPLIDMGRTALNVSGAVTAGTVTARSMGEMDMDVFNSDAEVSVDGEEAPEHI